jgi:hypothetical protein
MDMTARSIARKNLTLPTLIFVIKKLVWKFVILTGLDQAAQHSAKTLMTIQVIIYATKHLVRRFAVHVGMEIIAINSARRIFFKTHAKMSKVYTVLVYFP